MEREGKDWRWVVPVGVTFLVLLVLSLLSAEDDFLNHEWVRYLRYWGLRCFPYIAEGQYPEEHVNLEIQTCLVLFHVSVPLFVAAFFLMKQLFGVELSVLSKSAETQLVGRWSGLLDCALMLVISAFFVRGMVYVAFLPGIRSFSSPFNRAYALTLVMAMLASSICGLIEKIYSLISNYSKV